jgi:hypothetical protein
MDVPAFCMFVLSCLGNVLSDFVTG